MLISLEDHVPSKHYRSMNFVFQSYPSHPWIASWSLEPRNCTTALRETGHKWFFQTGATPGSLMSAQGADWLLQIPILKDSRTSLLFNGFCSIVQTRKHIFSAEVLIPEPGVVWGRYSNIPAPNLITTQPIETSGDTQWLDSDTRPVLLMVRNGLFCLVTKKAVRDEAVNVANNYITADFEARLKEELHHREGATSLFKHSIHYKQLTALCTETLMRALRPPEGTLSGPWSCSGTLDPPTLLTNEIYPLSAAWNILQPTIAEQLLLNVLQLQTNSGALPLATTPQKVGSILEAPLPVLAKTVEKTWSIRKDSAFAKACIPLLRRHLQWSLHHFDQKRRGLHRWQNSREPLIPDLFQPELATVDLTALLLTEIDALNRLCEATEMPLLFQTERENLQNNLQTQFWDEKTGQFNVAYQRDLRVQMDGFTSLVPLLWENLPTSQRDMLVEQLQSSKLQPNKSELLSWRSLKADHHHIPINELSVMLDILQLHDPQGVLTRDFTRLKLKQLIEWHTRALEEKNLTGIDPALAGFIIRLIDCQQSTLIKKKPNANRLLRLFEKTNINNTDIIITCATLLLLWITHLVFHLIHQPPALDMLDMKMHSAYLQHDNKTTVENGMQIIRHYPDQAALARLLIGNILIRSGDPATAETFFADVRAQYPDSPSAMISLGLAYQLQGRFKEAESNYYEFAYLFDEIFPALVAEVERNQRLMQEGFTVPPNWTSIYRYKTMHEIEPF